MRRHSGRRPTPGPGGRKDHPRAAPPPHQTIRKVTQDMGDVLLQHHIATLMELTNALAKVKETPIHSTPEGKAAWDEADRGAVAAAGACLPAHR